MTQQKRMILIGKTAAGKTTLCQYLTHQGLVYHKTQTIAVMGGQFIDTPGEYLERVRMRGALSVTAADADIILFVQDPTAKEKMFPPAYAGSFAKPVVGIVTKSDIATEEQLKDATEHLKAAGADHIFVTSSVAGTGFKELFDYLDTL